MVDARQLHAWLGVRDTFHQWMNRRIETYGFEVPSDFCTILFKTRGRPRTDYLLTVDMAKELSMVERTERGLGLVAANGISNQLRALRPD